MLRLSKKYPLWQDDKERFFVSLSPLTLLDRLSKGKSQGVVFEEITMEKGLITLKGRADSIKSIEEIKTKMEGESPGLKLRETEKIGGDILFVYQARGIKEE